MIAAINALDAFYLAHRRCRAAVANGLALAVVVAFAAAASWAAGGWYLLIPPRSEYNERAAYLSSYKILDGRPLSQWSQQGAYDSAAECEAVRNTFLMTEQRIHGTSAEDYIKGVGAAADPAILRLKRLSAEISHANAEAYASSRCVASDDPRLR